MKIGLAAVAGGLSARSHAADADPAFLANLLRVQGQKMDEDLRFTAFALKADAEAYAQVAALFRASAVSAKVQVRSHASLVKELGGTPKAAGDKADAASTKDNLAFALKEATHEAETLYPELVKAAQDKGMGVAVRVLTYSKAAITEQAKLYRTALEHLEEWKGAGKVFYVCPVCGLATLGMATEVCPICHTPKGMFTKVV